MAFHCVSFRYLHGVFLLGFPPHESLARPPWRVNHKVTWQARHPAFLTFLSDGSREGMTSQRRFMTIVLWNQGLRQSWCPEIISQPDFLKASWGWTWHSRVGRRRRHYVASYLQQTASASIYELLFWRSAPLLSPFASRQPRRRFARGAGWQARLPLGQKDRGRLKKRSFFEGTKLKCL